MNKTITEALHIAKEEVKKRKYSKAKKEKIIAEINNAKQLAYNLIAQSIHRSGIIESKNKIKQEAREDMRQLIVSDLSATLKHADPSFDKSDFIKKCGIFTLN